MIKGMEITHESSMAEFERLLQHPMPAPEVPAKPLRGDLYSPDGRSIVSIVRADDRGEGVREALRLIGGVGPVCAGVGGEVIIKPNCNHDIPYPRNSHPDMAKNLAEALIEAGVPPERIVVGDMSGMYKGLPTRHTMENLGLRAVAEELGIRLSFFEEEDWVTVRHPRGENWPDGMRLPRRVYEAERLILSPILRPHTGATFSMALKLAVGLMDASGRRWLHNGESFYEKLAEFNLAFSADLAVIDGLRCYVDRGPEFEEMVEPGVIIAGSNRVAADAVAVAVMKQHKAHGVADAPVRGQRQLALAERLGLGRSGIGDMVLRSANLADDAAFDPLVAAVRRELGP